MAALPVEFKNIRTLKFFMSDDIFSYLKPIFLNLEKCEFTELPIFQNDIPEFGIKKGMYVLQMDKRDFRVFKKWRSHYDVTSFSDLMRKLNKQAKVGEFLSIKIVGKLQKKLHLDPIQVRTIILVQKVPY